jgi:folate-dependent phosphoribosylglycinamide formyltransferase PurN
MNILILGPESRNRRIIEFLSDKDHDVSVYEDSINLDFLASRKIEFLISNGYAPILKPPVTTEFAGRIINIHPSFLPYGRGIAGNFWSFLKGSPKGVCIHLIDDGIDTGGVLFRRAVNFEQGDTLRSSLDKLMSAVEQLFFENWEAIASGDCPPLSPDALGGTGTYHTRRQTEKLLDCLPDLWDTPSPRVEELGADIFMGRKFWHAVDKDIIASVS